MAIEDMVTMGMSGASAPAEQMSMEEELAGLAMDEDAMFSEMAPKGAFSKGALNSLVKAHNKLSTLFGMEPYPTFAEDITIFPIAFVRELAMIMAAVEEAIAMEVLESDMAIDLSMVKADRDLASLAGRLEMIAKSKDFKKFLQEAPQEVEPEAEVAPDGAGEEELSEADMDNLMMERM